MPRKKKLKNIFLFIAIFAILGIASLSYAGRGRLAQIVSDASRPEIPRAQDSDEFRPMAPVEPLAAGKNNLKTASAKTAVTTTTAAAAPEKINLAVPFTPQAPHADWDQPYQDGCEETSAAMVHYYYSKQKFASPDAADEELKKLFAWEDKTFGFNKDTTALQTAQLLKEYYGYARVEVREVKSSADIKKELAAGRPVIVPAYGKALKNPNFKNGGPVYHMLVIKGFIGDDTFITNDPGTRKGADYVYSAATVFSAIHDWNGGNVPEGSKVMIIVYPNR